VESNSYKHESFNGRVLKALDVAAIKLDGYESERTFEVR